jgi:methenyltetrahydrofolate cyclohydrolase
LASSDLLDRSVAGFLDDLAAETPAPGGGGVAALAVALGASLAEMVARFSGDDAAAAQAHALRSGVAPLAQADAEAYAEFLAVGEAARSRTIEVPLEIAANGAQVAALAAELAERGKPALRGDALAGALVAGAGARIAAGLVEINVGDETDERVVRARELAAAAASATS